MVKIELDIKGISWYIETTLETDIVPIQVYFFSRNKVWKEYERIQSDIFYHLLAMVPKFDLKVYQYSD